MRAIQRLLLLSATIPIALLIITVFAAPTISPFTSFLHRAFLPDSQVSKGTEAYDDTQSSSDNHQHGMKLDPRNGRIIDALDDQAGGSHSWWRLPGALAGTLADSSVFVEATNSLHPSRPASFSPPITNRAGLPGLLIPIEHFTPSNWGCPPSNRTTPEKPKTPSPPSDNSDGNGNANGTEPIHPPRPLPGFPFPPINETWIALVPRGKCTFSSKILHAQELGAAAIVVGDTEQIHRSPDDPRDQNHQNPLAREPESYFASDDSSKLLTMYPSTKDREKEVWAPSVFVSGRSRGDLERLIREQGEAVEVEIPGNDAKAGGNNLEGGKERWGGPVTSMKINGLRVVLSQDEVWSWPLLDLLILLLFLPSVLTLITLVVSRIQTIRRRKAERAPKEAVERLRTVIWSGGSSSSTAGDSEVAPLLEQDDDIEKGLAVPRTVVDEDEQDRGEGCSHSWLAQTEPTPVDENTPLLHSASSQRQRRHSSLGALSAIAGSSRGSRRDSDYQSQQSVWPVTWHPPESFAERLMSHFPHLPSSLPMSRRQESFQGNISSKGRVSSMAAPIDRRRREIDPPLVSGRNGGEEEQGTLSDSDRQPFHRRSQSHSQGDAHYIHRHRGRDAHRENGPSSLPFPIPEACAICQEGFEKGDLVRILPCNHGFHAQEVDEWLLAFRKICPTCRASITSPPTEHPPPSDAHSSSTQTHPNEEDSPGHDLINSQ